MESTSLIDLDFINVIGELIKKETLRILGMKEYEETIEKSFLELT